MIRAIPLLTVIILACDSPSEPEAQVMVDLTRVNAPEQLQALELTIGYVGAASTGRGTGARLSIVQPDTQHCLFTWIYPTDGGCRLPLDVMALPASGLRIAAGKLKAGSYELTISASCDGTLSLRDSLRVGAVALPAGRHRVSCGGDGIRATLFQVKDGNPVTVAAHLDVGATLATLDNLSGFLRMVIVFRGAP